MFFLGGGSSFCFYVGFFWGGGALCCFGKDYLGRYAFAALIEYVMIEEYD